ncbi:hypothetical protein ACHAW5_000307 [Stephanodiscus triporus]|uniref:Uncharacterized protein n=1 Tax=Stephanodiscus triporus TaxID=2934178 RepID=A0ABD3MRU6_9STRA
MSITIDRKLETEVRILSVMSKTPSAHQENVDAHSLTSDEVHDIRDALMDILHSSVANDGTTNDGKKGPTAAAMTLVLGSAGGDVKDERNNNDDQREQLILRISIDTDAYVDGEYFGLDDAFLGLHDGGVTGCDDGGVIRYVQGRMKNRSGEPDARSDVRGRGKINVDGAASQALHGFQRGKKSSSSSPHLASTSLSPAPPRILMPLLAVATDGIIKLRELSWFGEHRETIRLGGEGGQE